MNTLFSRFVVPERTSRQCAPSKVTVTPLVPTAITWLLDDPCTATNCVLYCAPRATIDQLLPFHWSTSPIRFTAKALFAANPCTDTTSSYNAPPSRVADHVDASPPETVTWAVARLVVSATDMAITVAVPPATPVTSPVTDTAATAALLDRHTTPAEVPDSGVPDDGVTLATRVRVSPMSSVAVVGDTLTTVP